VILGYAGLIAHHPGLEDELRQDVDRIQLAAKRAVRLTRQMAILGRRETVEPEVLDVSAVLEAAPSLLADSFGPDVRLELDLAPGLGEVSIHRGQLEQVVLNLAENARDAMPDGGTLTIETSAAGDEVRITVTDTGRGMAPEEAAGAFEPFFTTKPKGEGTGLGLAIVYGIVIDAGGRVSLASTAGAGTAVTVLLPTV
jgi:signal transduction histidine kinase